MVAASFALPQGLMKFVKEIMLMLSPRSVGILSCETWPGVKVSVINMNACVLIVINIPRAMCALETLVHRLI